jgi:DNA repair protein RecO (recombination protein O)
MNESFDEILVLKEIDYKENDKILHALSKTKGKIQLISKGCRKTNSHLMNVSQIFAYARCTFNQSKDMYIITSAELIESFYNLRNNMESFVYGNYILELISYIAQENDIDPKIFDMTVKLLHHLSKSEKNFDVLISAYELKLVSMLGYKPDFKNCLSCSDTIKTEGRFSIEEGGFFCKNCTDSTNDVKYGSGINVSYHDILTMDKLLRTKFESIIAIENVNSKITGLIRRYLYYHIGKENFAALKLL